MTDVPFDFAAAKRQLLEHRAASIADAVLDDRPTITRSDLAARVHARRRAALEHRAQHDRDVVDLVRAWLATARARGADDDDEDIDGDLCALTLYPDGSGTVGEPGYPPVAEGADVRALFNACRLLVPAPPPESAQLLRLLLDERRKRTELTALKAARRVSSDTIEKQRLTERIRAVANSIAACSATVQAAIDAV